MIKSDFYKISWRKLRRAVFEKEIKASAEHGESEVQSSSGADDVEITNALINSY